MLKLHHLENSQSIRILWLLEELGTPYEMEMYDRDRPSLLAPERYKQVSPLGTAPAISDGDVTLAETNAIVDYILDQNAEGAEALRPTPGAPERRPYLFWFHAAQGSLQPLLTTGFLFNALKTRAPALVRPLARAILAPLEKLFLNPRLTDFWNTMDADLAGKTWLAGERFTAADIVMGYCLEMAAGRGLIDNQRWPHVIAYLQRLKARPAYQRALEKDGKFDPNFA